MQVDRARAKAAFTAYVEGYDPDEPKIALKIEHTWRVATLAERIARAAAAEADTPLVLEDVDLAWLLGLLHDVGRFEQVRQYGTFNDAHSVSHAALGAKVLFDGYAGKPATIRDYVVDASEDALIRTAIELHSSWRLPAGQDPRTRCLCDILRDADKIDILKVNVICPVEDIYGIPEQELLASEVSDEAMSWFSQHSTMPRGARRFPADVLLSHVCFVWELTQPESYRLAVEQGNAFTMMERPWVRDDTREKFGRMERHLKRWLREQGYLK